MATIDSLLQVIANNDAHLAVLTARIDSLARIRPDTVLASHPLQDAWIIPPGQAIGWAVTLVGIAMATRAALWAQEHRRKLDDDEIRKVLRDAAREGLGMAITLVPSIVAQLKSRRGLPASMFAHLDLSRAVYDANRGRMVHWMPEAERHHVQLWFREAAVLRAMLDRFLDVTPAPAISERLVASTIAALERSVKQARELYAALGFPQVQPGQPGYEEWAGVRPEPQPSAKE